MATFPSTSAKQRGRGRSGTKAALLLTALLLLSPHLRAGTVITLTNGAEIDGTLSVSGAGVHAEAESSPPDTPFSDVLESTFDDAPFTLSVFDSGKINQLPPNWTAQNVGAVVNPGAVTVQAGAFSITGSGAEKKGHDISDGIFYVSMPWLENGQFSARLASLTDTGGVAGLLFRDSLDPKAPLCSACLTGKGQIRLMSHGIARGGAPTSAVNGDAPIWLRFTREGNTVFVSTSLDGNDWDLIDDSTFLTLTNPLVGMFARGISDKTPVQAVFDNVSLTPLPSSAQILPAGVLLQGGSLLVGRIAHLNLDPAAPDQNGMLLRGDGQIPIPRSAIAAVVTLPIQRSQVAQYGSNAGILMRNGDTMDGDISDISAAEISVSSVLLGLTTYKPAEVRACFLSPLQSNPAPYEVRLRDGSILNATAVTASAGGVTITDASGVTVQAGQDEIAQIRAGTAVVQNLAQLDWKATVPAGTSVPPPIPGPGAAGANPAPAPAPPLVNSWLGKDQQQILEAGTDTAIDFPLSEKFRAFGVQIVLSSDSPPNATAIIHILTDGHELAKSPPFHVGDPPRFLELSLPTASHLTLQAESMFPGTKVLYLDPVTIR